MKRRIVLCLSVLFVWGGVSHAEEGGRGSLWDRVRRSFGGSRSSHRRRQLPNARMMAVQPPPPLPRPSSGLAPIGRSVLGLSDPIPLSGLDLLTSEVISQVAGNAQGGPLKDALWGQMAAQIRPTLHREARTLFEKQYPSLFTHNFVPEAGHKVKARVSANIATESARKEAGQRAVREAMDEFIRMFRNRWDNRLERALLGHAPWVRENNDEIADFEVSFEWLRDGLGKLVPKSVRDTLSGEKIRQTVEGALGRGQRGGSLTSQEGQGESSPAPIKTLFKPKFKFDWKVVNLPVLEERTMDLVTRELGEGKDFSLNRTERDQIRSAAKQYLKSWIQSYRVIDFFITIQMKGTIAKDGAASITIRIRSFDFKYAVIQAIDAGVSKNWRLWEYRWDYYPVWFLRVYLQLSLDAFFSIHGQIQVDRGIGWKGPKDVTGSGRSRAFEATVGLRFHAGLTGEVGILGIVSIARVTGDFNADAKVVYKHVKSRDGTLRQGTKEESFGLRGHWNAGYEIWTGIQLCISYPRCSVSCKKLKCRVRCHWASKCWEKTIWEKNDRTGEKLWLKHDF